MTLNKARLVLFTFGVIQLTYRIPLGLLYIVANFVTRSLDKFTEKYENRFWDKLEIRQEALKAIALWKSRS